MNSCFFTNEKRNIKKLIKDLSGVLNTDINTLSFLEEMLDFIILNNKSNSLEELLENYFSLLESEMVTLIERRLTPAFQFGIKNKYFTFIGYHGKFKANTDAMDIDENTYFSFDSISKIITSIITMMMIRDGRVSFNSTINSFNPDFNMDASVESILKFTAMIQTDKRIDNLSREETIEILKSCRENILEKSKYKNYYQYNDLGYMILRLSTNDFLERLDIVLKLIDPNNLTYNNIENRDLITGGKLNSEHITPDPKGRGIIFPGHTGLYGNIEGLLNLFSKVFYSNTILSKEELNLLLSQPYPDPITYTKLGNVATSKNGSPLYMAKVAGIYRKPNNITNPNYDKMASCDFSNLTTDNAKASAGTCGSWVMGDDLSYNSLFGSYVGGILTNPYSYVKEGTYTGTNNIILNTNLTFNEKGVILGYSSKLNPYKNIIAKYGILLELLTEYIKNTYKDELSDDKHITYIRKLKNPKR